MHVVIACKSTQGNEMKLTGIIQIKRVAVGSKSERDALVINDKGVDFVLRRFGGNAMEMDDELFDLAGEMVELEGDVFGNNLFIFKKVL